jgi:hypothetical protein
VLKLFYPLLDHTGAEDIFWLIFGLRLEEFGFAELEFFEAFCVVVPLVDVISEPLVPYLPCFLMQLLSLVTILHYFLQPIYKFKT